MWRNGRRFFNRPPWRFRGPQSSKRASEAAAVALADVEPPAESRGGSKSSRVNLDGHKPRDAMWNRRCAPAVAVAGDFHRVAVCADRGSLPLLLSCNYLLRLCSFVAFLTFARPSISDRNHELSGFDRSQIGRICTNCAWQTLFPE